jgi:hypothetical protein
MPSGNPDPKTEDDTLKPEWKDYIALVIALLQTIFLPLILMIIVLIVMVIILF